MFPLIIILCMLLVLGAKLVYREITIPPLIKTLEAFPDKSELHLLPMVSTLFQVMLKGPNNPYEVTFYSMTNAGKNRPVRIEKMSVNSIVVDNEPQDHHERLMIAAHIQLNPSGNACIARDTTLMPNIHGLPFLVSMLFAPCIEMRLEKLSVVEKVLSGEFHTTLMGIYSYGVLLTIEVPRTL